MRKIDSYKKHVEKKFFFRYLLETSQPSIVALVNTKEKKILIQATQSPYQFLGQMAHNLAKKATSNKELKRDRKKLSFKVLSHYDTIERGMIDKLEWLDHYRKLGYAIYNTEKLPNYKVRTVMTLEYKVQVRLVSAGRRTYPVKEFDTKAQADEFIKAHTIFDMLKLRQQRVRDE